MINFSLEYFCAFLLIAVGTLVKDGRNINCAAWVITAQVIIMFLTQYKGLTWAYSFLLSLTIAICIPLSHEKSGNKLYNPLKQLLAAQVVFFGVMFLDYRYNLRTVVDAYYFEIAVLLTVSQTMAAINGDTGIIDRIANRLVGFVRDLWRNYTNYKVEAAE